MCFFALAGGMTGHSQGVALRDAATCCIETIAERLEAAFGCGAGCAFLPERALRASMVTLRYGFDDGIRPVRPGCLTPLSPCAFF